MQPDRNNLGRPDKMQSDKLATESEPVMSHDNVVWMYCTPIC